MYSCCLVILVLKFVYIIKSDSCTEGMLVNKNYTIIYAKTYPLDVSYWCTKSIEECEKEGEINKAFNGTPKNRIYQYSTPIKQVILSTVTSEIYSVKNVAQKDFVTDIIILPSTTVCRHEKKYCYDLLVNSYVFWNSTPCQLSHTNRLYAGPVEEWTLKDLPRVRFITFSTENNDVLQLISKVYLCGQHVWKTDIDYVYVHDNKNAAPFENENISQYISLVDKPKLYERCPNKDFDKLVNYTNTLFHTSIILTIALIVFLVIKFICGVIVNCFVLKRSRDVNCVGVITNSFSQSMTYQQLLHRKKMTPKNVSCAKIINADEEIYQVNDFYDDC